MVAGRLPGPPAGRAPDRELQRLENSKTATGRAGFVVAVATRVLRGAVPPNAVYGEHLRPGSASLRDLGRGAVHDHRRSAGQLHGCAGRPPPHHPGPSTPFAPTLPL